MIKIEWIMVVVAVLSKCLLGNIYDITELLYSDVPIAQLVELGT